MYHIMEFLIDFEAKVNGKQSNQGKGARNLSLEVL